MKEKRDVSGIYFRFQNPKSEKWENWVFEDLPELKQDEILTKANKVFVENLCKMLANKINEICERFDITANHDQP